MKESESYLIIHRRLRRPENPDDIRALVKGWRAMIHQPNSVPLKLENWAVPLSMQPRARLAKSRRNQEIHQHRIRYRDLGI